MFVPLEFSRRSLVEFGDSLSLHGVIQSRSRVAMEMSLFTGQKHLEVTSHGQESVTSGDGIFVFQQNAIVRIVYSLVGNLSQGFEGLSPFIVVRNASSFILERRLSSRTIESSRSAIFFRQRLIRSFGPFLAERSAQKIH